MFGAPACCLPIWVRRSAHGLAAEASLPSSFPSAGPGRVSLGQAALHACIHALAALHCAAPPAGEVTPNVGVSGVRCRHAAFAAHPSAATYPGFPAWLRSRKADAFNTVFTDKVRACLDGRMVVR